MGASLAAGARVLYDSNLAVATPCACVSCVARTKVPVSREVVFSCPIDDGAECRGGTPAGLSPKLRPP